MLAGHFVWELPRLREIAIPDGFERVEDYRLCDGTVECVKIPASVKEICAKAFYNCKRLKHVMFKDGTVSQSKSLLTVIGEEAFRGCSNLEFIDFPAGLEEIRINAFCESGLESVRTPSAVRVICPRAFFWCENLKTAVLNEGLEALGTEEYRDDDDGAFYGVFGCSALENISLPSTLKVIGCGTFKDCKGLKGIQLPDGLERLGRYALSGSGLESIRLPPKLKAVGTNAF